MMVPLVEHTNAAVQNVRERNTVPALNLELVQSEKTGEMHRSEL